MSRDCSVISQITAGVGVKNAIAVDISNAANRVANAFFKIKLRIAGNLAGKHNEVAFRERLAGHAAQRILFETGIENVIADCVANFVRMTFGNGFGGKDITMRHGKVEMLNRSLKLNPET